jgi:hypothetical protein
MRESSLFPAKVAPFSPHLCALVSLGEVATAGSRGPLAEALAERARRLCDAFRRIVSVRVRISAVGVLCASSKGTLAQSPEARPEGAKI